MGIPFDPSQTSFNRGNALYLAHAANVAYHRWPRGWARRKIGLEVEAFRETLTGARGFLGICDTHAVLAFSGSDPTTLRHWITDVVVRLVPREEYDGRVHLGFSSAIARNWEKLEKLLAPVGDRPLFITGHSLGGALAVLTGYRLARSGKPPAAIYTFGSPRIGDRAFCASHSVPTFRLVNRLDLVPELPLASVKRLLPETPRITNEKVFAQIKQFAARVPCYGHVKTLVYLDRDRRISIDPEIQPWHIAAVARAVATRGKSFHEGITDHLMISYIRALEGGNRRKWSIPRRRKEKRQSPES